MPELPVRIHIFQRVVQAVGVAVEALREVRALDVVVGREETAHHGVVHPAVHINQAEAVQVLVPREAAVEHGSAGKAAAPGVGVARGASAGRVCRTVGHL